MKAILRSINNFSCKLKQSNNLKYNISPKMRSNKFKSISGNGNIVIEDAIKKDLKDYKVYGNTYQNITRGINIFNINNGGSTSSEISIDNDDYVSTAYNNANGSVTHYSNFMRKKTPQIQPSTNYLIVVEILSVQGTGRLQPWTKHAGSCINNSNPQLYFNNLTAGQKIFMPVTTKSEFDANTIYDLRTLIIFEAGQSGSITFRLSLLTDTTVTSDTFEYEPYTGGQPSPNPDYSQEIISCGDRTKNKFLVPNSPSNSYRATYSKINNNSFSLNYNQATADKSSSYARIDFDITQFKPNTRYTISKKHTVLGDNFTNAGAMRSYINGSNGSVITGDSFSFTTPNEITSLGVYFYLGYNTTIQGESTITFYDIQIEENSTATPYEPYGKYKIPVNVRSKNIFNGNVEIGGWSFVDGGVSQKTTNERQIRCTNPILVEPNTTYTFSLNESVINVTARYIFVDKDNIILSSISTSAGIITTPANCKYLVFHSTALKNNYGTNLPKPMIEKSTQVTKYQPYYNETTNIYLDEPLRKIDEYSDYIDFKNGKVVRQLGEVILDNNNTWTFLQAYSRRTYYTDITSLKQSSSNDEEALLFANCFKGYSVINLLQNNASPYGICRRTNQSQILIRNDNVQSINDFQTWISSNPVTVDYVLSTPTEEDIELPNINLIEGKNIITIGTELQGVFEVEYYSKEIIDISNYKYNLRKVED